MLFIAGKVSSILHKNLFSILAFVNMSTTSSTNGKDKELYHLCNRDLRYLPGLSCDCLLEVFAMCEVWEWGCCTWGQVQVPADKNHLCNTI